jgi:dolichol kinase
MQNEAFNFEVRRKIFHLYSLILPLSYIFISKISMCIFLVLLAGITLYIDTSRHYNEKIKGFVEKIFGQYLRSKERTGGFNLSGASYMALGLLTSCLFFSKGLAITSWLVLIISDCLAALIGMKFGTPLANGKSLVGSGVFFASSVLISLVTYFFINYNTSFLVILLSSGAVAAVEFYSDKIKIDDNFTIPFSYCLITSILSLIF